MRLISPKIVHLFVRLNLQLFNTYGTEAARSSIQIFTDLQLNQTQLGLIIMSHLNF